MAEIALLREYYANMQRVLAILLRRQDEAQTVITAKELLEFSSEVVLHSCNQPDGGLRIWVTP